MKKIILGFILIAIIGTGGYFIFKKPTAPNTPYFKAPTTEPIAKCGDNICDEFERANLGACPMDCNLPEKELPNKVERPKQSERPAQSSNTESPFGFHPGNADNYSYIKDLGAKWSREGYYLMWNWVDSSKNGNYNFTKAQAPAVPNSSISGPQINYDAQWLKVPQNIKIVANICPFIINVLNKETGFNNLKEYETYQDFAKKTVERYDGDNDYGCAFSSPDCYKNGDSQYPSEETIKYFQKNPIKYWQVCNQLTEISKSKNEYAETFASVQERTYKSVKSADGSASVLIAGDSSKEFYPEVFKKLGGKYVDIIDFHRFGNNYNPKEDFDYLKSSLRSSGFDANKLKFWMTETGTYSGGPSSDADKNLSYMSEKQQASVLVKIYVSGLSYGIEKIFWAWNIVEGFSKDGRIFDYTGLVYDGCDYVDGKYQCGSNVGYDKGRGVKKLAYYTYKKMVEILEGSDWNNIETVQEQDGVYAYKFMRGDKPIWVAWNDNDDEKKIIISGVNSPSVKITEAVPNYSSGKEVTNYNTAFKTENKQTNNGKLTITLGKTPVFVEEN